MMTDTKSDIKLENYNYSYDHHISQYTNNIYKFHKPLNVFQDSITLLEKYENETDTKTIQSLLRSFDISNFIDYDIFKHDVNDILQNYNKKIINIINNYISSRTTNSYKRRRKTTKNLITSKNVHRWCIYKFYVLNYYLVRYFRGDKNILFFHKKIEFMLGRLDVALSIYFNVDEYILSPNNKCIHIKLWIVRDINKYRTDDADDIILWFNLDNYISDNFGKILSFTYQDIQLAYLHYYQLRDIICDFLPKIPIAPIAPFPKIILKN